MAFLFLKSKMMENYISNSSMDILYSPFNIYGVLSIDFVKHKLLFLLCHRKSPLHTDVQYGYILYFIQNLVEWPLRFGKQIKKN